VGLSAALLAGCTSTTAATSHDSSPPTISLASSSVTGTATWATLAMGHLDDPLNTFWQLLTLSGSKWRLTTPPGVASNGGLVAATESTSVLTGFEPSQDLEFSPLARTSDLGATWQVGVLPSGLAPVPDALAQRDGESLALLQTDGGKVVANAAGLSTWTSVTTASALEHQATVADCHIRSLTAITIDTDDNPLVGASCEPGGRVGLFTRSSGNWVSVGPRIPRESGVSIEVIRLDQTNAGTAALVIAGTGKAARLYAMWSGGSFSSWTISGALPLNGAALLSTGVTNAGDFIICIRAKSAVASASVVASQGQQWQSLPALPSGTTSVTATPAGKYEALEPVASVLSIYALAGSEWSKVQSLHVDIPYGSSN
jgi:hypothetical protein